MRPWFAAVVAVGGLAAEILAVRADVGGGSAVLDLAAGWGLLAAAVAGRSLAGRCRLMAGLAGAFWFVGTLQAVGHDVGRVGELWGSLYAAPLAAALLSAPAAVPARRGERALVGWLWLRGAIPALAAWNLATLATGSALTVAGMRSAHGLRAAAPRRAAVAFGVALFPDRTVEPGWLVRPNAPGGGERQLDRGSARGRGRRLRSGVGRGGTPTSDCDGGDGARG